METRQAPCGLLIKLEKDTLGRRHNGDDYVLGYYDRLDILPVGHWFSYSPGNVLAGPKKADGETSGGKSMISRPVSYYPIKLVFPTEGVSRELEELGLDYAGWKFSGLPSTTAEGQDGTAPVLFNSFPCITVALVNLTDQFKGDFPRDVCGNQLKRLAEVIKRGRFRIGGTLKEFDREEFRKAHCCILPSLGYSDYCMLFAEESWSLGQAVMEFLHGAAADVCSRGKSARVPVLSTDYIMPVYHVPLTGGGNAVSVSSHEKGIQLTVRVNLRPGVSMRALKQKVGDKAEVFQITGSADCLLVSEQGKDFNELLRAIMPKHRHGSNLIENLVIDTETTLKRKIIASEDGGEAADSVTCFLNRSTVLDGTLGELKDELRRYQELIERENRHMRRLNAMRERVASIENICGEFHNLSFQNIVNEWLLAFNACFGICLQEIQECDNKMAAGDGSDEEKSRLKRLWEKTEDALDIFIEQVGSFMADLSRSGCFFMESERYNHPSVGSATALLIAYNQWQNSFAKAVMREAVAGDSVYTFLVQSGGCDATHTSNLFWFLVPDIDADGTVSEQLPLISQMSEMSLFDCGGTVFRMTHECMHYCGNRYRIERTEYLIRFTSRYYGRTLSAVFFHREAYLEHLLMRLKERMLPGIPDTLGAALEECWKQHSDMFAKKLANFLETGLNKSYHEARGGWDETDYMGRRLCDWMRDQLSSLFSSYSFSEDYDKGVFRIGKKKWDYNEFSKFIKSSIAHC